MIRVFIIAKKYVLASKNNTGLYFSFKRKKILAIPNQKLLPTL